MKERKDALTLAADTHKFQICVFEFGPGARRARSGRVYVGVRTSSVYVSVTYERTGAGARRSDGGAEIYRLRINNAAKLHRV